MFCYIIWAFWGGRNGRECWEVSAPKAVIHCENKAHSYSHIKKRHCACAMPLSIKRIVVPINL